VHCHICLGLRNKTQGNIADSVDITCTGRRCVQCLSSSVRA